MSVLAPRTDRESVASSWPLVFLGVVAVAAVALRWSLFSVESGDYRTFLDPWYTHLAENGFAGLKDDFANYNTPYLVLLWLLTLVPVPQLVAIKGLSVLFDLVLAGFGYLIVRRLRPDARWWPVVAATALLFTPTVVMNSGVWAQCDAVYASFCVASLYFLISRRPWLACVMFGLAVAFKLQAVFFLPVLLVVLLTNRMKIRSLLAVPAVFLATLVPAMLAGRSLLSQLAIYPSQITSQNGTAGGGGTRGGGGMGGGTPPGGAGVGRGSGPGELAGGNGGGGFGGTGGGGAPVGTGSTHSFTYNAPTAYAWLPADASDVIKYVGLGLVVLAGLVFGVWLLRRRRALTGAEILLLAASVTLVFPVLLPDMHERYFYVAEVLTVLAVFVNRKFLAVSIGIQFASVFTYLAYLVNGESPILPLGLLAVAAVASGILAMVLLIRQLRTPDPAVESGELEPVGAEPALAG